MQKNSPIGAELLRQEGLEPGQISDAERKEIRAMLDVQQNRAKRMRWVMIVTWLIFVLCMIVFGLVEVQYQGGVKPPWLAAAAVVTRVLLILAVLMTLSYYVRHRAASTTEINLRLANIEAKLRDPDDR